MFMLQTYTAEHTEAAKQQCSDKASASMHIYICGHATEKKQGQEARTTMTEQTCHTSNCLQKEDASQPLALSHALQVVAGDAVEEVPRTEHCKVGQLLAKLHACTQAMLILRCSSICSKQGH